MLVYLINPDNPTVVSTKANRFRLNKFRVWKPLGLFVLSRATPPEWEVEIIDENLGPVNYSEKRRPDLVGVTAFTSQAPQAYRIAKFFREKGVPVVMGGIHATMCTEEALRYVDVVVTGEGEKIWPQVLRDAQRGTFQKIYEGGLVPTDEIMPARHDLLAGKYYFGAIQTRRGCPLRCSFCSVTAFNGGNFRHRPIETVISELQEIKEKAILFVDDNLIGTRSDHAAYSKKLFRTMIQKGITTPWFCQATINFGDDEELLDLAVRAGCIGVFIGFESPTVEGLVAIHKKFNIQKDRDFRASVRRIQSHGILVLGSFILGIDTDKSGIGKLIAKMANDCGMDAATALFLTPLPGTDLFTIMKREERILANNYPEDWQHYTFSHPIAKYKNFSWSELNDELDQFTKGFYSYRKIFRRIFRIIANCHNLRQALRGIIGNLIYRHNNLLEGELARKRINLGTIP